MYPRHLTSFFDVNTSLYNSSDNTNSTTLVGYEWLVEMHPVGQTLLFTFFNAFTTGIGASLIFCAALFGKIESFSHKHLSSSNSSIAKRIVKYWDRKGETSSNSFTNNVFLPLAIAFGGGVMMASSFFGLIMPALNHFTQQRGDMSMAAILFGVAASFFSGIVAIMLFDWTIHKIQHLIAKRMGLRRSKSNMRNFTDGAEDVYNSEAVKMDGDIMGIELGHSTAVVTSENNESLLEETPNGTIPTIHQSEDDVSNPLESAQEETRRRSWVIFVAMTLHNIPEGIIAGVAFAAASNYAESGSNIMTAVALSLGIAIQNIPEGIAVSFPIYGNGDGMPMWKAFLLGCASGLLEPVGGLLGCALVLFSSKILPYSLAFAGGVMLFVVIHELVPLMYRTESKLVKKLAVLVFFIGFLAMMALDIGLS